VRRSSAGRSGASGEPKREALVIVLANPVNGRTIPG